MKYFLIGLIKLIFYIPFTLIYFFLLFIEMIYVLGGGVEHASPCRRSLASRFGDFYMDIKDKRYETKNTTDNNHN